jgi:C5HC2 zinc finger
VGMRKSDRDDVECSVCRAYCHLSALECECSPGRYTCAEHAENLCSCAPQRWRLAFRHSLGELEALLAAVIARAPPDGEGPTVLSCVANRTDWILLCVPNRTGCILFASVMQGTRAPIRLRARRPCWVSGQRGSCNLREELPEAVSAGRWAAVAVPCRGFRV